MKLALIVIIPSPSLANITLKAIRDGMANNTCNEHLLAIAGTLAFVVVVSGGAILVLATKLWGAKKELSASRKVGHASYRAEQGGTTEVTTAGEKRIKSPGKRSKLPPPATGARGRGRGKMAKKEERN